VSDTHKLMIYSLFKQASCGDSPNKCDRKGAVEESKFNAWKSQKGKTKKEVTEEYVMLVKKISDKFDLEMFIEKALDGSLG